MSCDYPRQGRGCYSISKLRDDLTRYHIKHLYTVGILGCVELLIEDLDQVLRDGFSAELTPHSVSPWLLVVPHRGIGLLVPHPRSHRGVSGVKGWVRLAGARLTHLGKPSAGRTRTHRVWQGRKPISDAPLIERIQSTRSRAAAAKAARAMKAAAAILLLILGALTASAQVVSGYSITHQQTPECTAAVRYLLDTLGRYPHPRDWQFVVVCDDPSWDAALRQRSGHQDVRSCDIYGATYLDLHLTLLRGSKFGEKTPDPELVIAHELVHIYLHSTDEARVDMVSRRWVELARGCMTRLEAMR